MSPPIEVAVGLLDEGIPAMLDDLEEYLKGGNRAGALLKATEIVEKDPECVEGLWALLNCGLPDLRRDGSYRVDPTLPEAAKGWALAKRIVALDPTHQGAWIRGAILATQHLGLAEEVLQWWESYREHHPSQTTPVIEQAGLLIRMGHYSEASKRMATLLEPGMDEMHRDQLFRVERMNRTIQRYYDMENLDVFRPQNPNHSSWKDINGMRNLKPASEKFTFFMLAGPLVLWEAIALQWFMPNSCFGMGLAFMLVYASVLWVKKISISITDKRNRPVLDLWRAVEVEATSGKVCIPEQIRDAKLYRTVMTKDYPVAFRQRLEKIVENNEELSKRWEMKLPEWMEYELEDYEEE
ncbi:MAG: hypothetical protein MKZ56_03280 [Candidatus Thalassarchaeum sp.]|nr:hypothetical protein [Candidatus Thalassarchaeum sp.]